MKKVRVEFFRPTFPNAAETFEGFLQRAATLAAVSRLQQLSDEIMLLITGIRHINEGVWVAEIHRIRTTGFPGRIDLTTLQEEELGLLAQQGLVDRIHFAYRTDMEALALQASRDFRPSTFRSYIQYVSGLPFDLPLVLKRGAYERLLRLRTVSTMSVRVANPPDAAEFTGPDAPGVAEIAKLLRGFGAARVEIKIRREKRRGASLIYESVRDFVDRIVHDPDTMDSVEALWVEGKRDEEDNLEAVDFVRDRLMYSGKVDFDAQRRLDPHQCTNLVINALTEYEAELRRR